MLSKYSPLWLHLKLHFFHITLYLSQQLTWFTLRVLPYLHGHHLPCPVKWKHLDSWDPALVFLHSQPFEPGRVRLKYLLNEWGQLQPTEVRWPAQGGSSWQKWHEKPVLPGGTSGKEPACHCRRHKRRGFDPWVRKRPWRRAWQPTPVFSPGKPQGQRSLEGYSPKADTSKAPWHTRTHPGSAQQLQRESSSLPAETALRAQLSVLLSGIMNVTWVKVLASFSTEQSSINCSGSSGPRFQGTHSADDLLISALGSRTKKQSGLGVSHSPLV